MIKTKFVENYLSYQMLEHDYTQFKSILQKNTGIELNRNKRKWVEKIVASRLKQLRIATYSEYFEYLNLHDLYQLEFQELIKIFTVNYTGFYRDPAHFHFLEHTILPDFVLNNVNNNPFRVWSAACSSGEEPYTLSICLSEYSIKHPQFHFEITASDINDTVLKKSMAGVYNQEQVYPIPPHLLEKYFFMDECDYKIKPVLSNPVKFKNINLIHNFPSDFPTFDLIFCRYALMYFPRTIQQTIVNYLFNAIKPGGYLLIGLDETLDKLDTPFNPIAPAIYKKPCVN